MSRILYEKSQHTSERTGFSRLMENQERPAANKTNTQHTKHTQPPQLAPGKRLKTTTWRPLTFGGFFLLLLLVAVVAAGAAVAGYRASSAEDLDRYKRLYTITVSSSSSFFFLFQTITNHLKNKEKFQK
jgi:hypothetical protein